MSTMDENAIDEAVHHFRQVLNAHHELLGENFRYFPRGCCMDASELLAAYLKDKCLGTFALVTGLRHDGDQLQSHAWLEKGNLIIDVTADQFAFYEEQSLVTKDRTWYEQFSAQRRTKVDGDFREDWGVVHLDHAWGILFPFLS